MTLKTKKQKQKNNTHLKFPIVL